MGKQTVRIDIGCTEDQRDRWTRASQLDPQLKVLPNDDRKRSVWVRKTLDHAAAVLSAKLGLDEELNEEV